MISEAHGIPLLVCIGPANQRDEQMLEPMVKALPMLPDAEGKRRKKPKAVQGDRGYGFVHAIKALVAMMITSLLAPRGSPHGSGLGKTRYVVERTLAWLGNNRRLKLCYERNGEHFRAFHVLAACVICANRLAPEPRRRF